MLPQLDAVDLPADAVEVGRMGEPWGVKGWFKVHAYSSAPEALFSSKRWYLGSSSGASEHAKGASLLRIIEAKEHGGGVVAGARDVVDRDSATLLRGCRIFIARSAFPSADPDEYYWVDLLGLEVFNRECVALGQVGEFLTSAAQTVMVLHYKAEGKILQRMIPFVGVYVDSVDLPARRIVVDWQPDYG
ncbi:MAG: ribosome maturation factor RimM [Rhodoferax sp.]|nr:ribosome maturation factor RimM [Rhodoferax sp.]